MPAITVNDSSESEGEDAFPTDSKGASSLGGTTRSEREETLRNLMNDDDGKMYRRVKQTMFTKVTR